MKHWLALASATAVAACSSPDPKRTNAIVTHALESSSVAVDHDSVLITDEVGLFDEKFFCGVADLRDQNGARIMGRAWVVKLDTREQVTLVHMTRDNGESSNLMRSCEWMRRYAESNHLAGAPRDLTSEQRLLKAYADFDGAHTALSNQYATP